MLENKADYIAIGKMLVEGRGCEANQSKAKRSKDMEVSIVRCVFEGRCYQVIRVAASGSQAAWPGGPLTEVLQPLAEAEMPARYTGM